MALVKENITYVDGYNVINKWPKLRETTRESLQLARENLIEDLAEYSFLTGEKLVIVFDAYNLDRLKETTIEKYGMKIVFTKRFQTADTYIEAELARIARRHNVKVVTDDGQVQNMALVKGASRMTALELKTDLDMLRIKIKKTKKANFSQNYDAYPISKALKAKLDELKIDLDD
ncbi:NYN domain-containing protein [uncultured Anaerococcus sp.]|uniref:NYN domain-containing protein n=1 Tax=uncultured Anaerococcus sp. TaxID=293428 RepID=UPI00288A91CF|nr:NYN domain-containing protein [uncultured Anaerococcus sp.]